MRARARANPTSVSGEVRANIWANCLGSRRVRSYLFVPLLGSGRVGIDVSGPENPNLENLEDMF